MSNKPRRLPLRLMAAMLACSLAPFALAGEDFPAPPRSEVTSVSPGSHTLGMQLSVRRFDSRQNLEQVLAYYREFWGEGEYAESELPPWKMITSRQGDEMHQVQVQTKGFSESWGYLSISDLAAQLDKGKYSLDQAKNFPMMSGSQVINDQTSTDPGKTGRTLLLFNDFSPGSNATFYRNHYRNQGWELIMDEPTAVRDNGFALYFRRGTETVAVTINKTDGKTSVVANQVSRGLLSQ